MLYLKAHLLDPGLDKKAIAAMKISENICTTMLWPAIFTKLISSIVNIMCCKLEFLSLNLTIRSQKRKENRTRI